MTPARLRKACLSHDGAVETFPFRPETSVFKVAGKIFALTPLRERPLTVSLKCDPQIAVTLRAAHPEITPGYHLNKRHWNTIALDGALPDRMVLDMIEDSYDLVVASLPAKTRERLHWTAVVDEATQS
jgi:predicted DNA-binding protein (MmcQ/YjbR family)